MTTDTAMPFSTPDNLEQCTPTPAATTNTAATAATAATNTAAATVAIEPTTCTTTPFNLLKTLSVTGEATTMALIEQQPVKRIDDASINASTEIQTSPPMSLPSTHSTTSKQQLLPEKVNAPSTTATTINTSPTALNTTIPTALNTTPATVMNTTPATVMNTTPATVMNNTPASAVNTTPASALKTTPVTAVNTTPATSLKTTPVTAVNTTPATALKTTPVPAVNTTPATAVNTVTAGATPSTAAMNTTPSTAVNTTPSTAMNTTPLTAVNATSATSIATSSTLATIQPSLQSHAINNKRPNSHRPSAVKTKRPRVSSPAVATPTRPSTIPLADPHVVTMVHDMMGLMQLYGPLTVAQLEYNLPRPWSKHTVTDTLQVLVATGMVQVVLDSQPTQYCMFHGVPRPDVILPSCIMEELETTFLQTTKSEQRIAKLKDALLAGTSAKEVLTSLLKDHPDIVKDPVYLAALQNVHVDTKMIHPSKI